MNAQKKVESIIQSVLEEKRMALIPIENYQRLLSLCLRAADALEGKSAPYLDHRAFAIQSAELIAELREAGK